MGNPTMKRRLSVLMWAGLLSVNATAQTAPAPGQQQSHGTGGQGAGAGQHARPARAAHAAATGGHDMTMGPLHGGNPPPGSRDPNAYNEGAPHRPSGNAAMHDDTPFGEVLIDKAEVAKGDGAGGQNVEIEAWYGNDDHKAWVKVELERRGGMLESTRTELLWDRACAPFWSTRLGIRHDRGDGGGRDWLAFGIQLLAPHWLETQATAYWRPHGGLAAGLAMKSEVLFSSRLILEPELGANLYSRADPGHGTGKGLSDLSAGVRLRYQITRQFAPYIGVTWSRQVGGSADLTRMRGDDRSEVQAVAGVRMWF